MENSRGFQSRIGFILVSAGCAIGIGNVWKFPYMVGSNGGAVFVILYLVFLAILGIPVMTMELAERLKKVRQRRTSNWNEKAVFGIFTAGLL